MELMYLNIPLIFTMLLSMLPAGTTASDEHFLDREVIMVPTTGVAKMTSAPLEPYAVYRVQFSSPRDLADIAHGHVEVCLNGTPAQILDFDTGLFDAINHAYSLYQGTGDPLTIQLRPSLAFAPSRLANFAERLPTLEVTIARRYWWQNHRSLGIRPEVIRAALVILGVAILIYVGYQHGRDALNHFIAQFTRRPQGGMGFPPPQDRRHAQGRVRVIRNREEGGTHEH